MKRRSFLSGLGAVAAMPAIPASAFVPTRAAVSAAAYEYFDWAKMIVRAHDRCSPDMLQRLLKLSPEMAKQVQAALLKEGVIGTPSIAGVSKAIDPLYPELKAFGNVRQPTAANDAKMPDTRPKVHDKDNQEDAVDAQKDQVAMDSRESESFIDEETRPTTEEPDPQIKEHSSQPC